MWVTVVQDDVTASVSTLRTEKTGAADVLTRSTITPCRIAKKVGKKVELAAEWSWAHNLLDGETVGFLWWSESQLM